MKNLSKLLLVTVFGLVAGNAANGANEHKRWSSPTLTKQEVAMAQGAAEFGSIGGNSSKVVHKTLPQKIDEKLAEITALEKKINALPEAQGLIDPSVNTRLSLQRKLAAASSKLAELTAAFQQQKNFLDDLTLAHGKVADRAHILQGYKELDMGDAWAQKATDEIIARMKQRDAAVANTVKEEAKKDDRVAREIEGAARSVERAASNVRNHPNNDEAKLNLEHKMDELRKTVRKAGCSHGFFGWIGHTFSCGKCCKPKGE